MPRQARGMKGKLLLAFEQDYGVTPVTPAAYRLPFNTNSLTGSQGLITSNTITGRRDPVEPGRGTVDVSGTIVIPLDVRNIGIWLTHMFGAPVTTGEATPYTHVWTLGDTMPSASIEKGFGDIGSYGVYPGVKVSKFSLSAEMGNNELTASLDVMGANEVFNATSMAASPTELALTRFNIFQGSVKENATTLAICRKFEFNIDFGLDGDTYCFSESGSPTRQDINEGLAQITGSIETLFKDSVLLNKAINGTETSLEFKFANGAHSLSIVLGELVFERKSPGIDGPKGVVFSPNYQAYFSDSANNSAVKITLINDVDSYALPA